MRVPFLLALVPGLWVYGPADAMNDKDLPLMITYMTWMAISFLFFFWTLFQVTRGRDHTALIYRINNWFLVGVMLAVAIPTIIDVTATMLIIMYTSL